MMEPKTFALNLGVIAAFWPHVSVFKTKPERAESRHMMAGKKAAKKGSRRKSINYEKLAQMWAADKTYEEMGKALGMKGNEENDPYKPVRAAISNMLNGKATAWKDGNGKVKTLKPRKGMKSIGVGKKVNGKKKATKKAAKKAPAKKTVKNGSNGSQVDGKTLASGVQANG